MEGIVVSAPRWTFENLTIRGACRTHDRCEHAFHVVGGATGFIARNNTITDFNAHFKINSLGGKHPDKGSIEHNTLRNNSVRNTAQPVTIIDIVAASEWTIASNLITDFVKAKGNTISYGAFAKGAGAARASSAISSCASRSCAARRDNALACPWQWRHGGRLLPRQALHHRTGWRRD